MTSSDLWRAAYAMARQIEPQALPCRLLDLVRQIMAQLRPDNKGERS